jgi:hypothetical protein
MKTKKKKKKPRKQMRRHREHNYHCFLPSPGNKSITISNDGNLEVAGGEREFHYLSKLPPSAQ